MVPFRERVFRVVKKIPKGKVLTYKMVAKLAGNPKAWRAVGNILNKNLNPKIIPCHRVIKSNKEIGGYKYGIKRKISLLKKEGMIIKNGRAVL
jgi:methylated-DNA-[protein]-cysteine S-methyltransferase